MPGLLDEPYIGYPRAKRGTAPRQAPALLLTDPAAALQEMGAEQNQRWAQFQADQRTVDKDPGGFLKPSTPEGKAARDRMGAMIGDQMNVGGLTAWHGTPHVVDKFSSSKIGTGEGAQAYGYGLYFAEHPEIAKYYQQALSGDAVEVAGRRAVPKAGTPADQALAWLTEKGDPATARQALLDAKKTASPAQQAEYDRAARVLDYWGQKGAKPTAGGNLYKVDIADEAIPKMLDWDKPLHQQPENVRRALGWTPEQEASYKAMVGQSEDALLADLFDAPAGVRPKDADIVKMERQRNVTGGQALENLQEQIRQKYADRGDMIGATQYPASQAAFQLQRQGIPGVRYLDRSSRGAGTGTSNFVVFPGGDDLIKILERNGENFGLGP